MNKAGSIDFIRAHDTFNQVSVLQSISQGNFEGFVTVSDLQKLGDTGIGTFDGIDGELVMIDGVVYQCLGNGTTIIAPDNITTPFANLTFFDEDIVLELNHPLSFEQLRDELNGTIMRENANLFYVAKIECDLESICVRSVLPRRSGEGTLAQHMANSQTSFEANDIKGTIVAVYCPPFMSSLNMPGWHMHFLSTDKQLGGHILNLQLRSGTAILDQTSGFSMILPDDISAFANMDLTIDQSSDLELVEAGTIKPTE